MCHKNIARNFPEHSHLQPLPPKNNVANGPPNGYLSLENTGHMENLAVSRLVQDPVSVIKAK